MHSEPCAEPDDAFIASAERWRSFLAAGVGRRASRRSLWLAKGCLSPQDRARAMAPPKVQGVGPHTVCKHWLARQPCKWSPCAFQHSFAGLAQADVAMLERRFPSRRRSPSPRPPPRTRPFERDDRPYRAPDSLPWSASYGRALDLSSWFGCAALRAHPAALRHHLRSLPLIASGTCQSWFKSGGVGCANAESSGFCKCVAAAFLRS